MTTNLIETASVNGDTCLMLNTMMSDKIFAQTKMVDLIEQQGILFDSNTNTFMPWQFSGTTEIFVDGYKTPLVALYGNRFDGKSLLEILNESSKMTDTVTAFATVQNLIAALHTYSKQNPKMAELLPACGPAGILCKDILANGGYGTFLILPEESVKRTLGQRGERAYAASFSSYSNPTLDPQRSQMFTIGVFLYQALCGRLPFEGETQEAVYANIADCNFDSPKYALPGLNSEVTNCISRLLSQQPAQLMVKIKNGKQKTRIKTKTTIIQFEDILQNIPIEYNKCCSKLSDRNRQIVQKKGIAVQQHRQKHISRIRFIRKFRTTILAAFCGFIILSIFVNNAIVNQNSRPTTIGMEPMAVVQKFYTAISELDLEWPEACLGTKVTSPLVDTAVDIYVLNKQSEYYARKRQLYTPGQWWNLDEIEDTYMFGLTRMQIAEITEPDIQQDLQTHCYQIDYYVILPQSNEDSAANETPKFPLSVFHNQDIVAVSYQKDRWRISKIQEIISTDLHASADEILLYRSLGKETPEIPWGPTQNDIKKGAESLIPKDIFR